MTIGSILATNLLVGVLLGIAAKLLVHVVRGVPVKNVLAISFHITHGPDDTYRVKIDGSAIFSNFIALKSQLATLPKGETIVFDLADVYLIDHTVMDFISAYRDDYLEHNGRCEIQGLDEHAVASEHELAARIKQ
jgi:MFS superfamily sulfate permease-like transporter